MLRQLLRVYDRLFSCYTAFKFSACELDFIKKTKRWKWWISDEIKKIVYFPHAKRTVYLLLDNFSNFSLIHLTMKICHTRFFIDTALILSCLKCGLEIKKVNSSTFHFCKINKLLQLKCSREGLVLFPVTCNR